VKLGVWYTVLDVVGDIGSRIDLVVDVSLSAVSLSGCLSVGCLSVGCLSVGCLSSAVSVAFDATLVFNPNEQFNSFIPT